MEQIPLQLHQIWIGNNLSSLKKKHIQHNKTFFQKYKLWRSSDITKKNFPFCYDIIQKILKQKSPKYAQISDLMRYEILFHKGGIYADMNIEFVKSIEPLLLKAFKTKKSLILCHQDNKKNCPNPFTCNYVNPGKGYYLSNSFIGATKNNNSMLKLITSSINLNKQINHSTGPYHLRKHIDTKTVYILPTKFIYPFNWSDTIPYTVPSKNKCVSFTKKPGYFSAKDSCGSIIYIRFPCLAYKNSYAIKHWDTGGSWVQSEEKIQKCKLIKR